MHLVQWLFAFPVVLTLHYKQTGREWDSNDNEDVNALFNTVYVGFVTCLSLLFDYIMDW